MTIEQQSDYVDELYKMLRKIVRIHGQHSSHAAAMTSIYSEELRDYLERQQNEIS